MSLLSSRLLSVSLFSGIALLGLTFGPASLQAQRLPKTVKPEHYTLQLKPDLKTATFSGRETIDVVVEHPVDAITLNSAEIKFQSVTTTVGGKTLTAKVAEDEEKQQATFNFGQQLPAGKLKLEIQYTGILNNELRGFYLSKTAKRNYAVTQFESTDARRAFPSFDEPAMKATFSVTLVVDKGDTAISNTNIVHDVAVQSSDAQTPARHAITFAETPRMSTYLLAFLVGDFQCLSGSSDNVPIRVCATPDQVQYGKFALKATEYVLHYYDTYFGIKYPMPKLDMIAIPDFEAGAMENFGAITYRETDLLLDDTHASVGAEREVGLVVAHEMAHQWFGDMVTMEWWNNVWLNEGFATWMENKPIAAWRPDWTMDEEVARENQGTLDLDAQRTTRTIRANADTPSEINEMFDGISYGKAGAVLLMVENYVGEETFRQGVHKYLAAHMYGNATAEDFWSAQTEVSKKPIDKIMDSFVAQPGEPLLTFGANKTGSVETIQKRFFLSPKGHSEKTETWAVPVCFKDSDKMRCELLSSPSEALKVPSSPFPFANAEGKGYYRSAYTDEDYAQLVSHVESDLNPAERISVLGDEWALAQASKASISSYLDLVSAVSHDTSAGVIGSAMSSLHSIDTQIAGTPEERVQISAWVRSHFAAAYQKLGAPQPDDSPEKRELRAELLILVAGLGKDADAIAQAKVITAQSLADPKSVDTTLADAALGVAARNGDAALFDQLQKLSNSASNPQLRSNALRSLALFPDPTLEKRALEYAASGQVRNQDAAGLFAMELRNRDTQEAAWQYIRDNWDKVQAQLTTFGGAYIVGAAGGFCSADRIDEVTSFFTAHKVMAAERTLARAKDQISDCIDLRAAQEPNLKAWLAKQQ
jgi:aminopeptidase N/puromycin-sensitive aminopeptidase